VYEFPCYGSGVFNDVAIIDENDIWVVGDFEPIPYQTYNAVHWNGSRWEKRRIPFYDQNGQVFYTPLKSLFAFSKQDIWFEFGINWNGTQFISHYININFPSHANKMWGDKEKRLYMVGSNGLMAYRDEIWHLIQLQENRTFQDIWGVYNPLTGEKKVMAIACNIFTADSVRIYEINENNVKRITNSGLTLNAASIWSPNGKRWFVGSGGLYYSDQLNKKWKRFPDSQQVGFVWKVRGNGLNDIFTASSTGKIGHWNGNSWKTYLDLSAFFLCIDVKGDLVVAGGSFVQGILATSAVVVVGRRN